MGEDLWMTSKCSRSASQLCRAREPDTVRSSGVKIESTDFMFRIRREVNGNSQVADLEFIRDRRTQDVGRGYSGSGSFGGVRNLY